MTALLALLFAWAWDRWLGEPPNRFHPVAWLGLLLGPLGQGLLRLAPLPAFAAGLLVWALIAAALAGAGWWLQQLPLPTLAQALLLGLLLKPCLAWSMLRDEVGAVETALQQSLAAGRVQVARLVSRDVSQLSAAEVREAALSTLAENLNDSLVAPLFWFVVAGLPGALVYRFANTADAMWGYRGRWEWAGKSAAWADDALSWLPARLTALLLGPGSWRRLRAEAGRTPSPNGGWPMGALALRLGISLRKPGVYVLNGAAPAPLQMGSGLALCGRAAAAAWVLAGGLLVWRAMA